MGDPLGQALWDYYVHSESSVVKLRTDGNIEQRISAQRYFEPVHRWSESRKEVLQLATGDILDYGCGAGRHGLHLQAQGHDTEGAAVTPLTAQLCTERGLTECSIVEEGVVSVDTESFDTVLLLERGFGMGGIGRTKHLLSDLHRVTVPDGQILAMVYLPTSFSDGSPGESLHVRFKYKEASELRPIARFAPTDLAEFVETEGWEVERTIPDDSNDSRYFVVLQKNSPAPESV